jgi:hypothetical protein
VNWLQPAWTNYSGCMVESILNSLEAQFDELVMALEKKGGGGCSLFLRGFIMG